MKRRVFARIRMLGFVGIALLLLFLLSFGADFGLFKASAISAAAEPQPFQQYQSYAPKGQSDYPIMKPSRETRQKWIQKYKKAPKVKLKQVEPMLAQPPTAALDLLGHIQYTPSQRDQGTCGNCWAWAGTGIMEIALDVQEGIHDRLSIQYLNSNYNGGSGDWACCGGWLDDLMDFYAGTGRAIPWSNANASYADGGRTCVSSTSVPAHDISTSPYYPVTSIDAVTIPTQTVTQSAAIANIKNVLDQNKGVLFAFFMPTGSDADNFRNFWSTQSETAIWAPDFCDHTWDGGGGGHAVLCVGYNDDDPDNGYWIMLNSWGTTGYRPNGLFRLSMDLNYGCQDSDDDYIFYWQTLDITYDDMPPQGPAEKLVGADDAACDASAAPPGNFFLWRFQAGTTGETTVFKLKATISGNVKVAIYADNDGEPGARLSNVDTSIPVVAGWNDITIPSAYIIAGNYYWLAFISDARVVCRTTDPQAVYRAKLATYSTFDFPSPAGTGFVSFSGRFAGIAGWSISSSPTIGHSPASLSFIAVEGGANPSNKDLDIWNAGSDTLNWEVSVSEGDDWLSLSPTSGSSTDETDTDTVTASVNISGLTAGTYDAVITISAAGAENTPQTVPVTLTVNPAGGTPSKFVGADDAACDASVAPPGNFFLWRFQAETTGDATVFKLKATASGNVKVAIYADNAGEPGDRLSNVNASTPVDAGWNDITIPSTFIVAGDYYWLAFISDARIVCRITDPQAVYRAKLAAYSIFDFPDPAGTGFVSFSGRLAGIAGWGFTVPPEPPLAPTPLSPGTSITFKWSAATGATNYHLQVNTQPGFDGTSMFDAEVGDNTLQEVTGLSLDTTYYWRVMAGNSNGWSSWSASRSVTASQVP